MVSSRSIFIVVVEHDCIVLFCTFALLCSKFIFGVYSIANVVSQKKVKEKYCILIN
eukprot:m.131225 g.131225  ORF g.131225 m.131225 type:complete len:56 (+) comp13071_c0_seq3:313-480(+)